jgi:hypothetical protein
MLNTWNWLPYIDWHVQNKTVNRWSTWRLNETSPYYWESFWEILFYLSTLDIRDSLSLHLGFCLCYPVRRATKKTTFLRVISAHLYALKINFIQRKTIETAFTVNHSTFYAKKFIFLTRKNVRFLRVKTSFFCCLSDWVAKVNYNF